MRTQGRLALLALFISPWIASAQDPCRYMKSRAALVGYQTGGPYKLEHFQLTKARTDLSEFLWTLWHNHIKGVAEAKVGTIDAGTVTALYVVQPDSQGQGTCLRPTCQTLR